MLSTQLRGTSHAKKHPHGRLLCAHARHLYLRPSRTCRVGVRVQRALRLSSAPSVHCLYGDSQLYSEYIDRTVICTLTGVLERGGVARVCVSSMTSIFSDARDWETELKAVKERAVKRERELERE